MDGRNHQRSRFRDSHDCIFAAFYVANAALARCAGVCCRRRGCGLIRTSAGAMTSRNCLLLRGLSFAIALWSTDLVAQTLAEAGAVLYMNRCAGCHGEELRAYAGGQAFDLRRLRPDEY